MTRDLRLWPHQKSALSVISNFIGTRGGGPGPAALVRMPTGTGKSGVIAVAAQRLVAEGDVLLLSPWDALVDQLTRDVQKRFWLQIGAKIPTVKYVTRLFPSTAATTLAGEHSPAIWSATIATLQRLHTEPDAAYAELARRVALIVVDEGHYEPAPSWAKAVRELGRPTVLFTATPYRNDFKFFEIDKTFCSFYSHDQAEKDRIIRRVRFEAHEFNSVSSFCEGLVDVWKRLFPRKPRPRVIVRCRTKNNVKSIAAGLDRLGVSVIGIHERFESADGTQLRRDVPNPEDEDARFWVHQNKLIEGIDDSAFRLLAFFDALSNERAFIQQVGRVLRNPQRKSRQNAWIFHDPSQRLEESWDAYRSYDSQVGAESIVASPRDFSRVQPPIQYVTGRFRQQFDITSPRVHEDFDYPRSTTVYVVPEDYPLDDLADAIRREWDEYDFDLQPVTSPAPSTRLHPYIALRNSPLLLRKAFAEYEIGLTIYRRIRNYLFFYDSRGKVPEVLSTQRLADIEALQRLYAGSDARLTSVSLLNTNLSRYSTRRRVLQAYSIEELGPDLADHAQFASTATGLTKAGSLLAGPTLMRYVGFTHSRISDRVGGTTPFDEYMRWLEYLADALDDLHVEPLVVFDRFAEVIETPDDPTPTNILLDFDQEAFESVSEGAPQTLSIDDLCVTVSSGIFNCNANGVQHQVNINWDAPVSRYRLECTSLDQSFLMKTPPGCCRAGSLMEFLNREQASASSPRPPRANTLSTPAGDFVAPACLCGVELVPLGWTCFDSWSLCLSSPQRLPRRGSGDPPHLLAGHRDRCSR